MIFANLVLGDRGWIVPALLIAGCGVLVALWVNRRQLAARKMATACRVCGWLLIAACLVNPLWSSSRPRRGANVIAVVTDVSRSHQVLTRGEQTRGDVLRDVLNRGELTDPNGWLNRIDQDFELQRYVVSDRLERVDSFQDQAFERPASNLCSALEQLQQRFSGQPLAGIVLLSDGNATDDFASLDSLKTLAPVHSVIVPDGSQAVDVAIGAVTVNQTAFDDAPVTIQVQTRHSNAAGRKIQLTLMDADGTPLETKTRAADEESAVRF